MRYCCATSFLIPSLLLGCSLASAASSVAGADDWPRWRGPHDSGSNESDAGYPISWSADKGLLWKADLPGKACSTPVVWDKRIYLTAPVDGQDAVLAFDWAGKELWRTPVGAERRGKSPNGSGANPSAATDGQSVFAYFKSGDLAALGLDGKLRWKTNLQQRFGHDNLFWDLAASPVPTEKDVVVAVLQHGNSYLAAFDKLTGELHWKVDRNYDTPTEGDHGYATPIVRRDGGRDVLLVWGAAHLTAHDPADGKVLWSCGGFNPQSVPNWPSIASPVYAGAAAGGDVGGLIVVPYGRDRNLHLFGIKPGGAGGLGATGDVSATALAWERKGVGSFVPSPAAYKGQVYLLGDRGAVECIDPATGKTLWSGELPKSSAAYYASPALADGKLYAARQDGVVFVAKVEGGEGADGKFEVLSKNDMGERLIASPVPVAGRVLIRGDNHLFCVGKD